MSVDAYRHVLALPGVLRLLGFAVLGRVPHAGASVVLTLYVVSTGRGYGAAGLVAAVSTIGTALGQPWRGRTVDRVGLRRALLPSVLVEAGAWAAIPFVSFRWLLVVAFVGGVMAVPIFTVVRQSLAVLVPVERQRTAYALDSIGTELTFMAGPAIGVLLATQWSATGAVVTVGVAIAVAGLGLMVLDPPTRSPAGDAGDEPAPGGPRDRAAPGDRVPVVPVIATARAALREPALLRDPALLAVLAATAGALAVLAGTEVSIVAHAREHGDVGLTWVVYVIWSLASLVGGLLLGASRRSVPPFLLLLGLGILTLPVGLAPGTWWLTLLVVPAGFLCAPTITATAAAVSRLVPEHRRGEAMGWYGSAMTLGIAAGVPGAGTAIDAVGPWAGFALVGGVGVGVALIGLLLIRWATDRPSSGELGAPSGVSPTCRPGRSSRTDRDDVEIDR